MAVRSSDKLAIRSARLALAGMLPAVPKALKVSEEKKVNKARRPSMFEDFCELNLEEEDPRPQGIETVIHCRKPIEPVIPPAANLLMKSMFSGFANKTFRIRMTRTATLTTSGSGTMALISLVQPSGFVQYSALAAIFAECRIHATRIQYCTNLNPQQVASPVVGGAFVTAFAPTAITGSTTSISQAVANPGSRMFASINTNWPVSKTYTYPKNLPYSQVTASSGGLDPEGGIRGGWITAAVSTLSNSIAYLVYIIETDYEFRTLI